MRIVLPSRSDCPFVLASYLRSGIRLFEWPSTTMMHAKAAVVDGQWCTIGSYNIDPLSLIYNRELNLVLLGRPAGLEFEKMFDRDFHQAEEIDWGRWQARGWWRRVSEQFWGSFRLLF